MGDRCHAVGVGDEQVEQEGGEGRGYTANQQMLRIEIGDVRMQEGIDDRTDIGHEQDNGQIDQQADHPLAHGFSPVS